MRRNMTYGLCIDVQMLIVVNSDVFLGVNFLVKQEFFRLG